MLRKTKFSKDPKTVLMSLDSFLEENDYLSEVDAEDIWSEEKEPEPNADYYKVTSRYFIHIFFTETYLDYGTVEKAKLEEIDVALR